MLKNSQITTKTYYKNTMRPSMRKTLQTQQSRILRQSPEDSFGNIEPEWCVRKNKRDERCVMLYIINCLCYLLYFGSGLGLWRLASWLDVEK